MSKNIVLPSIRESKFLAINISDLEDGMRFDAPVFFEGDNLFLASGLPVRGSDLHKLGRMGITTVTTRGNLIHNPVAGAERPTKLRLFTLQQKETRCLAEYATLLEKSRTLFASFARRALVEKKDFDDVIHRIFHWTKDYTIEMIQLIHGIENGADDDAVNAIHSTIIAVTMGLQKKLPAHSLLALATAAFLHDIGMARIPAAIQAKKGKLDAPEQAAMQKHPLLSQAAVRELGYPLEIGEVVAAHHERMNGRGYPRGITQKTMHEHAQIIAVADTYAALINRRPYRRHLLGHDALKTILHAVGSQFSTEMVKLLIKSIGIYPPGTIVLLNNFSVCRVLETSEDAALRPRVEIIRDKFGLEVSPPYRIDLVDKSDLYIVKALDAQDIAS